MIMEHKMRILVAEKLILHAELEETEAKILELKAKDLTLRTEQERVEGAQGAPR
jgi:hypothetical protein